MYNSIRPGKAWLDTSGKPIQAHGFQVFYDEKEGRYIWYGENKETTKKGGYVEAVANSSNDDITGRWRVSPELLFSKDGGHGMIFKTFDGRLMLVLHAPNRTKAEHPKFTGLRYENGRLQAL